MSGYHRLPQPSTDHVYFRYPRYVVPAPGSRLAIDFASIRSALHASPPSPWQCRIYSVSRWTCAEQPTSQSAFAFWSGLIDHIESHYPNDAPVGHGTLLSLIGECTDYDERRHAVDVSPGRLADDEVITADVSAHVWCSVVSAFARIPAPRTPTIPDPPPASLLAEHFRRRDHRSAQMSKRDSEALSISVSRQLEVLAERIRKVLQTTMDELSAGEELATLFTVESVLHAFGYPGTAVRLGSDSRLVVAVEWASAGDLVPSHTLARGRRRTDLQERDRSERLDELARQLVRYLTAVARVALASAPSANSVEVLALEPKSASPDAPIVATLAFDRGPHERLNATSSAWLSDWIDIVDEYDRSEIVKKKSLDRFIKSHGGALSAVDLDLMAEVGPAITIGSRTPDGDLTPFSTLSAAVGGPVPIRRGAVSQIGAPASLYGVLFWVDVYRRVRQATEDAKREAEQRRLAQEAQRQRATVTPRSSSDTVSPTSSGPRARPRLSTRTTDSTEPGTQGA